MVVHKIILCSYKIISEEIQTQLEVTLNHIARKIFPLTPLSVFLMIMSRRRSHRVLLCLQRLADSLISRFNKKGRLWDQSLRQEMEGNNVSFSLDFIILSLCVFDTN